MESGVGLVRLWLVLSLVMNSKNCETYGVGVVYNERAEQLQNALCSLIAFMSSFTLFITCVDKVL